MYPPGKRGLSKEQLGLKIARNGHSDQGIPAMALVKTAPPDGDEGFVAGPKDPLGGGTIWM